MDDAGRLWAVAAAVAGRVLPASAAGQMRTSALVQGSESESGSGSAPAPGGQELLLLATAPS